MAELSEIVILIEDIFNRPFGILMIIAGLSALLTAVLLKIGDIHNRIADIALIATGLFFVTAGAVISIYPEMRNPKLVPASEQGSEIRNKSEIRNPKSETTDNRQPTTDNRQPATDNRQPTAKLNCIRASQSEFIWSAPANRMNFPVVFSRPVVPARYKIFGHYAGRLGERGQRLGERGQQGLGYGVEIAEEAEGLLAYPIRYERLWTCNTGTEHQAGSRELGDGGIARPESVRNESALGAVWRPVPPAGFSCLGDVAVYGHSEPDPKEVVCVRTSLTAEGKAGPLIWNKETTGSDRISVVRVLSENPDEGLGLNLFQIYGQKWSRKSGYASLPVLKREVISGQ